MWHYHVSPVFLIVPQEFGGACRAWFSGGAFEFLTHIVDARKFSTPSSATDAKRQQKKGRANRLQLLIFWAML